MSAPRRADERGPRSSDHASRPGSPGAVAGPLAGGWDGSAPVWEDGEWTGLPELEDDVRAEVCVVGLGGSGLTCIGELQALGRSVVGIDALDVGSGAAGRNGGFLLAGMAPFYHAAVRTYGRERARTLYRQTLAELDRIFSEAPGVCRRTGSLRIALSGEEEADCEAQWEAMREDHLPVERYEGPEGRGLLFPSDGVFNPLRRARVLAERVRAAGARLFARSPAVNLAPGEVRTPRGRIRCEAVVVAVDGRLERLLPELAARVRTARLQMLATAPTGEVDLPRPVYARYGYEYWQQLPDGRIALGGFRDLGGEGEWTDDPSPSKRVQAELERFLRESVGVRAPITHRWGASVSYTASGLPYLGEVRPGIWAAGGYSGTGNVIGAICGRAMAQLATRGESALALPFADPE